MSDQTQRDPVTNALVKNVATVLSVLGETQTPLGVPESSLYLAACNANLDEWNTLKSVMLRAGLLEVRFNAVSLTPQGKAMADKINAALAEAKAQAA